MIPLIYDAQGIHLVALTLTALALTGGLLPVLVLVMLTLQHTLLFSLGPLWCSALPTAISAQEATKVATNVATVASSSASSLSPNVRMRVIFVSPTVIATSPKMWSRSVDGLTPGLWDICNAMNFHNRKYRWWRFDDLHSSLKLLFFI